MVRRMRLGRSAAKPSGLVGHWRFDELGGLALDYSGSGNHGHISGATRVAGQVGDALSFDGVNNYVVVSDDPSLDITDNLTLTAWVNLTNYDDDNLVSHILRKNDAYAFGVSDDGYIGFFRFNGTVADGDWDAGANQLSTGSWYFIAVTYNSTAGAIVYKDAIQDGTLPSLNGSIDASVEDLWMGRLEGSALYQLDGLIDDPRIYNVVLTQPQLLKIYNDTK